MTKKVIRVPKGWPISYCGTDSETHKVTLTTNKEYIIGIDNGAKMYPIITVDKVIHDPKDGDVIVPKLQLDLGYKDPIHKPTCGNIPVSRITSVEEVRTGYESERRSKKDITLDKKNPFTFAFDKKEGNGEYRITVYPGEMLALSIADDRPDSKSRSRNIYCTFRDFDESTGELIVTRYAAANGVRQITENYKVPLDNLIAIFRYKLVLREDKKEEAPAANPGPINTCPDAPNDPEVGTPETEPEAPAAAEPEEG